MDGIYNPSLSEFVWGMTEELCGSFIRVRVQPMNCAYRTDDGKQVIMVKCFTLNFVVSQQLTFDVMKKMALLEQEEQIIVTESRKFAKI